MQIIDCITWIIDQQFWGYKIKRNYIWGYANKKKRFNTTGLDNVGASTTHNLMGLHGLLQGWRYRLLILRWLN
jgi:hypothetical protein